VLELDGNQRQEIAGQGRNLVAPQARSVDDDAGGNRPLVDFHVPLAARSLREVDNLCVAVDLGAALARPMVRDWVAMAGPTWPSSGV
jgi:hypothetical protein